MLKMNAVKEDQGFITRLEQLKFNSENSNSPSSLADAYRSLFLHMTEAGVKKLDKSALQNEAGIYLKKLSSVVDCMDESGMNNYAEGALALCSHHKNESSRWDSALSVESILQLPALQDLKAEENEEEDDPFIPLRNTKVNRPVLEPPRPNYDDTSVYKVKETLNQQRLPTACTDLPFHQIQESTNAFNQRKPWNPASAERTDGRRVRRENLNNPLFPADVSKTSQLLQSGGSRQVFQSTASDSYQGNFSFKANDQGMGHVPPGMSNYKGNLQGEEMSSNFEVNSNKYGGPFANFGQKRKVQNNWDNCQKSSNSLWQNRDSNEVSTDEETRPTPFKTAKQQFIINQQKKFGNTAEKSNVSSCNYGAVKKSLGTRRGPASKFVPPVLNRDSDENESPCLTRRQAGGGDEPEEPIDERLKGIDPKMIELINNEIMDHGAVVTWSDVAGLEFAKKTIKEIVVWPMLRPDIFTGLRGPPKGLLLFGPPGTGKTLIGKCIASQSKSTFFCISASSLTSKWVGEGEKMVRALFAVARCNQPAVVFIDEIDSLLSQRSDSEHESSRRIKTEFLVQLDGAATGSEDRILVIGATNRPQEIDEAARRRFVKRLLIPLPEAVARKQIVMNLMSQQNSSLSESDINAICSNTDGYSGADMSNLCREAALGPIRSIPVEQMETITPEQVRPILFKDFEDAMRQVRASVSSKDLELYNEWNKTYGSFGL